MERGYGHVLELTEDEIEQAMRRINENPVLNVRLVELKER